MPGIRMATRFAVDLPVQLADAQRELPCWITNLSLAGACVTAPALAVGARVALAFVASGHVPAFASECIVRWSDREKSGLEFDGLRASDVATLAQLIRRYAALIDAGA